MYKGFFEDIEYVMGLFCRPFEECCKNDEDEDDDEEKKCAMGCDQMPCMKDDDSDDEDERSSEGGGMFKPGPLQDALKCMFDASDIDYDYED